MPRLGPFELLRPVARGGMGVVWQGRHVGRDLPVAVKVLTGLAGPALGDLAAEHGRPARARAAYALAVGQLERLGRLAQAAEIAARMESIRD